MKDIEISAEFKSQAAKAISSIFFFIITYLLLLLASIVITALSIYIAVSLIVAKPSFGTLVLGAGLGSFGILIFSFLIKFLFKSYKMDRSHLREVTKNQQPELFQLIEEVVNEVESDFPKKVYFSGEVNASVFYDSSFWSMFLPVRKNLVIGLGLINTVTYDELKSILSHEFGHFSQRSMKIGSYVYYVNQAIHNLLNENDSYDQGVAKWADTSTFLAFFAIIALKFVVGIQWILAQMYGIVNKSYLGLSREMEFHADEIAASVTGYQPLADSLLRMQLSSFALNTAFGFYGDRIAENKASSNIFKEQSLVMKVYANSSELAYKSELPLVTFEHLSKFNRSKLVIENQWASHPSTQERVDHLKDKPQFINNEPNKLANSIVKNLEAVQKEFTQLAFNNVSYTNEVQQIPFEDFKEEFTKNHQKNTFSKIYNGYYDDKNPANLDLETIEEVAPKEGFDVLFSNEMIDLLYNTQALANDMETLAMINAGNLRIKSFDYDGIKYKRKQSEELLEQLKNTLEEETAKIKENDRKIYQFFAVKEAKKGTSGKLKSLYKELFSFDATYEERMDIYNSLSKELDFINHRNDYDTIRMKFKGVKSLEFKFKKILTELIKSETYHGEMTPQIRANFDLYLKEDLPYFGETMYFENNLAVLFNAMQDYTYLLLRGYFISKKELLEYQETLL
jgi:Zn-dependent protease with chaperone function